MHSVFIMTDLEGVAGVVSFAEQTYADARYNDRARKLLTAEVNAAVEGLLEVDVTEILVCDAHGSGAIWFEDLHPSVRLLHGRPRTAAMMLAPLADCDAAILVGQHAMAGTATGNLNHTQNSRKLDYIKLNATPIGEIAQFALYAGSFGKPLVFLSGDADACREVEQLIPDVTTACVKQGLGRNCAICVSAHEARRRIREGVTAAVVRHRDTPVQPVKWPGPYVLEKRFFTTDDADAAAAVDAERVDGQTVQFRSDDIREIIFR